ncbi:MAG: acyl-[acyl-carrier-protein] thioesterase [Planctomycetota bacterium]
MEVKEEKFRVRTFECQGDGCINMFSLMRYLQEIAAGHAEALGFGFDRLGELDGYWVLSNIRIEIARLPKRDDEVIITTWPSGHSRTVATREFVGKNRSGRETFRAGSEWMVMNKKTGRLKNLVRLGLDLPESGRKALPGELSRLELRGDYRPADHVRVPYSSIDLNGHVNNTEYVRWGIDALKRVFKFEQDICSLQATYLSEVFEGDEIDIAVASDGNGKLHAIANKPCEDNAVFLMEVVYS